MFPFDVEGKGQVYAHLVQLWSLLQYVPQYFFYDDACHLARLVCVFCLLKSYDKGCTFSHISHFVALSSKIPFFPCMYRFMLNFKRFDLRQCSIWQLLFAQCQVFVDRMHFKNHVDPWCREHMDANKIPDLKGVNTEVGDIKLN